MVTHFTEVDAIDLTLKLVNLLELIHDKNVVHTNLCPEEIFLKNKDLNQMQFLNLYHCTKDAKGEIGFKYVTQSHDISKFDIRTRNIGFISPEQATMGRELSELAEIHNGRIDADDQDIQDFIASNEMKITKKCDIYSLGAILYKLLIGVSPTANVSALIGQKRLHEHTPQ